MMDIKVQHENLSIKTSTLLTVPITVIPETSSTPATTIPPPILPSIPLQQQSTLIPTPTATEATTSTNVIPDSTTIFAIHQRLSDLENKVKTLLHVTIKSEVLTAVQEFLGTSLDDALYK
ncbi:hypothetical protein Tco_1000492, partial [Tanacetum coccineum]